MKRNSFKIAALVLAVSMLVPSIITSDIFHWIRVGAWRTKVEDAGSYAETVPGPKDQGRYFRGLDMFDRSSFRCWGTRFGCVNWLDEDGVTHPYMLAGAPYGTDDEQNNQWAVGDDDPSAETIHAYYRYRPPTIIVNGYQLSDDFPASNRESVDPSRIPGTADVLVESHIRNKMGLEITQRVIAWSQADHDDYAIWEWDIKNAGNIDRDAEIELNQTLEDLYILRQLQYRASGGYEWSDWVGMVPGDSLRMTYVYPGDSDGSAPSDMGFYTSGWGAWIEWVNNYFGSTEFLGDLVLYADATDGSHTDEWKQPQMHTVSGPDWYPLKWESGLTDELTEWPQIYQVISEGYHATDIDQKGNTQYMHDNPLYATYNIDPMTHHETPTQDRDEMSHPTDLPWTAAWWSIMPSYSLGPYDLAFGDSVRFVWAQVAGAISEQNAREWGQQYEAGTLATNTPGYETMPNLPVYDRVPDIIADPNDRAKDALIYTGKDSLFMNAGAAKYNFEHNYNIPIPPPAPDIMVTSSPDMIKIEWDGWQSESVADFAGYRVYRATGGVDSAYTMIFECGEGTANPVIVYEFVDFTAELDKGYHYYVAAFDDGGEHIGDYKHPAGKSLESGMFLNRTTQPAWINTPPVAVNDVANAPSGRIVAIDVLANDSDPDGDTLTIASAIHSEYGGAAGDTTLYYVSLPGFTGADTVIYIVSDGKFGFDTARVVVTVTEYISDPSVRWAKTYGGSDRDYGRSVQQTTDGGYIITGYTRPGPEDDYDIWLLKTDAQGDTVWTKTFGGIYVDKGYSVQQTADGGYIITGYTRSFGAGDIDVWLLKTDALGDTEWTRTYGGIDMDRGHSVQQTNDGGYVITGSTWSFGAGDIDVWLLKTDALGDTEWTRTYGGIDRDRGLSVQQTADGGYIITGCTRSFGAGDMDVWLLKTDALGDTEWTRTYGGIDEDRGLSVQQTADGGYIITGDTRSYGAGDRDVWLLKTDASGDTLWTKTFGGSDSEYGYSVQQTADGGYILTGSTASFVPGSAAWLIRTDANGDTLWTRTIGGVGSDGGNSIQLTADGGYIITGSTNTFGVGESDILLIRVAPDIRGPSIAGIVATPDPNVGEGITVTATVSGPGGVKSVALHYAPGGASGFNHTSMSHLGGGSYQGAIPGSIVTAKGMAFFISADDKLGIITHSDTMSVQVRFPAGTFTTNMPGSAFHSGFPFNKWRLISIPGDIDKTSVSSIIRAELDSAPSDETWKIFRYTGPGPDDYVAASSFASGESYFLKQIVFEEPFHFYLGSGQSVDLTGQDLTIPSRKWRFVSSPYPFAVTVDADQGTFIGPYTYGEFGSGGQEGWSMGQVQTTFSPWGGYIVYNNTGMTRTLEIKPPGLAKALLAKGDDEPVAAWLLDLYVEGDHYFDAGNVIGRLQGASDGLDDYDHPEPPYMEGYVSLTMERPDWEGELPLTSDIRSFEESNGVWDLDLRTKGETGPIAITCAIQGEVPPDMQVVILDLVQRRFYDLTAGEQPKALTDYSEQLPYHLKVIAGTPDYVQGAIEEALAHLPEEFALSQNYPNPFNPSTTIRFALPRPAQVSLKVYNLLGQEVVTLVDDWRDIGYHEVVWDGRDRAGRSAATGVYFAVLHADGHLFSRKMVLLK